MKHKNTSLQKPREAKTPSIVLENPKYARNVAGILRASSCFGSKQIAFTGNRVLEELETLSRFPREQRMKGYNDVDLFHSDRPFDFFTNVTPVCVELVQNSESLTSFKHPKNAVYIFGPEDGSVSQVFRSHCHRFISIPSKHCLNLSASVYIVLYDRVVKEGWSHVNKVLNEERGVLEDTMG